MKTKNKNVKMDLCFELISKLHQIETDCRAVEGDSYIMTITSAKDGVHMPKSKHYRGEAIDIRTRDMKKPKLVRKVIQIGLGKDYDVIFEGDHIHIEWDKHVTNTIKVVK
jgi:uncharacterized protein YcbK (DUF882 family)